MTSYRRSRPEVFLGKYVTRKFTWEHPYQSVVTTKVSNQLYKFPD